MENRLDFFRGIIDNNLAFHFKTANKHVIGGNMKSSANRNCSPVIPAQARMTSY
ncbi:hypothetical protein [Coxiella burnetii]|uniref:hypothetical protein n=1 Tax=Coxiella burnetii TaxID=777 RepID=UPI00222EADDC|nr:hypothetical protein [Coxiella burnetii]